MRYDTTCTNCHRHAEIEKSISSALPRCAICDGQLQRRYTAFPSVHFAAPGFYSTDTTRLRSQVGGERFERFERQKADIEARARAGRLTEYERSLETTT